MPGRLRAGSDRGARKGSYSASKFSGPLDVDGADCSEERQDDTQGDGGLGGGDTHDEKGVDLADDRIRRQESVEGHEVDAGPIQHELDGDEHADEGPALKQAEDPDAEKERCDKEVGGEAVHDGLLRA